jgi:hypothetical protein
VEEPKKKKKKKAQAPSQSISNDSRSRRSMLHPVWNDQIEHREGTEALGQPSGGTESVNTVRFFSRDAITINRGSVSQFGPGKEQL